MYPTFSASPLLQLSLSSPQPLAFGLARNMGAASRTESDLYGDYSPVPPRRCARGGAQPDGVRVATSSEDGNAGLADPRQVVLGLWRFYCAP